MQLGTAVPMRKARLFLAPISEHVPQVTHRVLAGLVHFCRRWAVVRLVLCLLARRASVRPERAGDCDRLLALDQAGEEAVQVVVVGANRAVPAPPARAVVVVDVVGAAVVRGDDVVDVLVVLQRRAARATRHAPPKCLAAGATFGGGGGGGGGGKLKAEDAQGDQHGDAPPPSLHPVILRDVKVDSLSRARTAHRRPGRARPCEVPRSFPQRLASRLIAPLRRARTHFFTYFASHMVHAGPARWRRAPCPVILTVWLLCNCALESAAAVEPLPYSPPDKPTWDYVDSFSPAFGAARDQGYNDTFLLASTQVSKILQGHKNIYEFGTSVAREVAGRGVAGATTVASATAGVLQAFCSWGPVCFTSAANMFAYMGLPFAAVAPVALPAVAGVAAILWSLKGTSILNREHVRGLTSHFSGTCYHGKFCGQKCVGEWPAEDALDELCYYHDVCLEKYTGPRWHCDEELRMLTKKLRSKDKALRARARVVQDSMAHVIINLKDFDGDDDDNELQTADAKAKDDAQNTLIFDIMQDKLANSFDEFPDAVAGDDIDSQESAPLIESDSPKTPPICDNARRELVTCIESGADRDVCKSFAEKHIECSARAARAKFAAENRAHDEL